MAKYKQGIFTPTNPHKWIGSQIVYRSSWEYHFMKWADTSPSIQKVASEEICIPYYYIADNKTHRYFPDFLIEFIDKENKIQTILVEIKPLSECIQPVKGRKSDARYLKEVLTYEKNKAKWQAAELWCKERSIRFMVITERELGL